MSNKFYMIGNIMENFISKFLPTLIMIESFLASFVYVYYKKAGQSLYWFAAGVLNFAVIYLMKIKN